jgi:hypothetical protein
MLDREIDKFVRDRSDGVSHSGRTFYEHLKGVYDLLEKDSAPVRVCLAGLCHSIYGTNIFQHASTPLADRERVAELIGKDAERLAYIFCSCARPWAFVEAAEKGSPYQVRNRRDGSMIALSLMDLCDLLEIEEANLKEQGGGKLLQKVISSWQSLVENLDA